jgi:energy-coupling factor transporter ATP-binding protein EcfA2
MNFPPISNLYGFMDIFRHKGDGHLRFALGKQIAKIERHNVMRMYWNGRATTFESRNELHWKKGKGSIAIDPRTEPNPHVLIVGMSGFGKSTLLKSMILELGEAGMSAVIFDAHSEHEDAVRSAGGKVYDAKIDGINIFELCGLSVAERIAELVGLFKELYSLGYIQAMKLSECMWYTYRKKGAPSRTSTLIETPPVMADLIAEIDIFIRNARYTTEKNTLLHLKERLSLLNTSAFRGRTIGLGSLGRGICSFSLAGLKNRDAQVVYMNELLRRLYVSMKDNKVEGGLSCYVVVDEAQFLIEGEKGGVIKKIFEEGRKYGVGAIIATHAASSLNKKITANASTFITFYSREPSEVSYVSSLISGNDQRIRDLVKERLRMLGRNQALVLTNARRCISVVRTRDIFDVKARMPLVAESDNNDDEKACNAVLGAAASPITYEVLSKAIGMDGSNVDAILEKLIASGQLDRFALDGEEEEVWFMRHNPALSIEHEVRIRKISEYLKNAGIKNWINHTGRGPDIVAYKDGKRIAVEYETGKKDIKQTSVMLGGRMRTYVETVVVVDDRFYRNYEKLKVRGLTVIPYSRTNDILGQLSI